MSRDRIIMSMSIIGLAALVVMLNFVSPTEIGPFGVLLFFTTLFIMIFGIVFMAMKLFYKMIGRKEKMRNKDYLYSVVISFGPIMLLMMRSFGAISLWTVGLIAFFLFLVGFLIHKKF